MKNYQRLNLVFLHGWGGKSTSWHPISERLKNKFNVYTPDLPGFGKNPLTKPYTRSNYAEFVVAFLEKNKIQKPVLVGHSFGGGIAIKTASSFPSVPKALILVDSAGVKPKRDLKFHSWLAITKIGKNIFSLPVFKKFSKFGRRFFYKLRGLQGADYFSIESDNGFLKETFLNLVSEDLTDDFKKIKMPTLIIWGENDKETLPADGRKMHELIKDSKLVIISNAGHFSYLDDQERFCQEVENFTNNAA